MPIQVIDDLNQTWNFQYWYDNPANTSNVRDFDLNATTSPTGIGLVLDAVYELLPSETTTPYPATPYPANVPQTITLDNSAYPSTLYLSEIYDFQYWRVNGTNVGSGQSVTVPMNVNTVVTAVYQKRGVVTPVTITVAVNGTGGVSTSAGTNPFTANPGDLVSVVAHPVSGVSTFTNWTNTDTGAILSALLTYDFSAPSVNLNLTANFAPVSVSTRTITFTVVGNGQIGDGTSYFTPGVQYEFDLNSLVHLVATPNTGNRFVNWSGSISGSTNPYPDFNITDNMTVTATFQVIGGGVTPEHTPIYEFVTGLTRVSDVWNWPIITVYDTFMMERRAT